MLAAAFALGILGQIPDETQFFAQEATSAAPALDSTLDLYTQIEARKFTGSCWAHYDSKFAVGYMKSLIEQGREIELVVLLADDSDPSKWIHAAGFLGQAHCAPINGGEDPGYTDEQLELFDQLMASGLLKGILNEVPEISKLMESIYLTKGIKSQVVEGLCKVGAEAETVPLMFFRQALPHSLVMGLITADFAKSSDLLPLYLSKISGRIMASDLVAWDTVVKPKFIDALRFFGKPEGFVRSKAYFDLSFHLLQVRSALNDDGSRELAHSYLTSAPTEEMVTGLLLALKSGSASSFFASELLIQYLNDKIWDALVEMPAASDSRSEILSAMLQRSRISPMSIKWIVRELENSRNPLKASILSAASRWGASAKDLFVPIYQSVGLQREEYRLRDAALNQLSLEFSLVDVARSQSSLERKFLLPILQILGSADSIFASKQAGEILTLVPSASHVVPYDLNRERSIFTACIYYFAQHWQDLDGVQRAEIRSRLVAWMKLAPDKVSDEALLRLVHTMKKDLQDQDADLNAIELDLRQGLGLK